MGLVGSAFSVGIMTGPAVGGLLADPSRGALGFHLPLFAAAGFSVVAALGVLLFVRETSPKTGGAHRGPNKGRLQEAFAHPVISRVLVIGFVVVSGFAGIEAVYGLWTANRFGWGPREVGLALMCMGALGAFGQGYLSGRMVRQFGVVRVLTTGLGLMALGALTQWASPSWPVAMLGFAIFCIGQSQAFPNLMALISLSAPAGRQGEFLGLNMSSAALARVVGPMAAGQLFSLVAPGAPFLLTVVLILPTLWFAAQVGRTAAVPA
jgi:predicted MFS family arabinose efflux permease